MNSTEGETLVDKFIEHTNKVGNAFWQEVEDEMAAEDQEEEEEDIKLKEGQDSQWGDGSEDSV